MNHGAKKYVMAFIALDYYSYNFIAAFSDIANRTTATSFYLECTSIEGGGPYSAG